MEKFYWNAKVMIEREVGKGVVKKHWLRVGSARSAGDSDVIEVTLDALPLHWKGTVSLFPVEVEENGGGQ